MCTHGHRKVKLNSKGPDLLLLHTFFTLVHNKRFILKSGRQSVGFSIRFLHAPYE